jgi:hypothetical protein
MADKIVKVVTPMFEVDDVINAAASFDTTPEVMAGALYGISKPITKAQALEKLSGYLQRPINNKEV